MFRKINISFLLDFDSLITKHLIKLVVEALNTINQKYLPKK